MSIPPIITPIIMDGRIAKLAHMQGGISICIHTARGCAGERTASGIQRTGLSGKTRQKSSIQHLIR